MTILVIMTSTWPIIRRYVYFFFPFEIKKRISGARVEIYQKNRRLVGVRSQVSQAIVLDSTESMCVNWRWIRKEW